MCGCEKEGMGDMECERRVRVSEGGRVFVRLSEEG